MRDIVIAAVCGIAMSLLPNTNTDNPADAGLVRQVTRTRTVQRCTDGNCPVTATVEVPTPAKGAEEVAAAELLAAKPGDTLSDGSKVVGVTEKSSARTRTYYRTGGNCCQREPVRRVLRGVAVVATRPLRVANQVRVNRMQARACRGNRVARARCCR